MCVPVCPCVHVCVCKCAYAYSCVVGLVLAGSGWSRSGPEGGSKVERWFAAEV